MSQYDLQKFLEQNLGRYYTYKQLSKHLQLSPVTIQRNCSKLRKWNTNIKVKKVMKRGSNITIYYKIGVEKNDKKRV